jgi:predicted phosphodiesterase
MSKIKKSLLVADVHGYEYDKNVKNIILQIAKDLKPDYLGLLGDMIDCEGVSKFTVSEWKNGAYDTAEEINYFREEYFLPLIKACNNKAMKIKMCIGNHEARIFDFLEKIKKKECKAAYEDWKEKLNLEKMFPEADIKPYNECHKIGKLYLTHGEFHNLAHPRKHATVYGRNIVYGHLHTWAVTTVATKADNSINSAYSIPCACKLNPSYMKNKSSAWVQGCAVAYVLPNGNYHLIPVIIINKQTVFNGKLYYAK